jgi:hypothetical protein
MDGYNRSNKLIHPSRIKYQATVVCKDRTQTLTEYCSGKALDKSRNIPISEDLYPTSTDHRFLYPST